MSKSYFPADRAGRIDWYSNFAKEFPKAGKDLGFSETEITNAVNDSNYAVHIYHAPVPTSMPTPVMPQCGSERTIFRRLCRSSRGRERADSGAARN